MLVWKAHIYAIHTYIHTYRVVQTYCMYVCMYVCMTGTLFSRLNLNAFMHLYWRRFPGTIKAISRLNVPSCEIFFARQGDPWSCMYVCMYLNVCVCVYVYVLISMCIVWDEWLVAMNIYTYIHTYNCTSIHTAQTYCTNIHTYIHTHPFKFVCCCCVYVCW